MSWRSPSLALRLDPETSLRASREWVNGRHSGPWNLHLFENLRDVDDVAFHAALERDETIIRDAGFPFADRLELARRRMAAVPGGVDGIITYWDFPSTSLTALLADEFGLPYVSPACDTRCEHKLWSREEEAKVIETPAFAGFMPFDDDPLAQIGLDFPFWVKPVVGHSSMLGFDVSWPAARRLQRRLVANLLHFIDVIRGVDHAAHGAIVTTAKRPVTHRPVFEERALNARGRAGFERA